MSKKARKMADPSYDALLGQLRQQLSEMDAEQSTAWLSTQLTALQKAQEDHKSSGSSVDRVLITGSKGFLGVRLAQLLADCNIKVIDCDVASGQDITDRAAMLSLFEKTRPNVCVHLAAVANLNFYHEAPERSKEINVQGTFNIIEACKKVDCRLLFASTCCAYGNNHCHPSCEDSPMAPTEPYAATKLEMEPHVIRADIRHIVMRLATFYGPNMRKELAPAIFLEKAHHEQTISVHGTGQQTRTMTYVDDVASGIVTLIVSPPEVGLWQVCNITTEESVSVLQMIETAKKVTKKSPKVEHVTDRPFQIHKEHILNQRLRSLGWKPQYSFEQGMEAAYKQYLADGACWTQSSGARPAEPKQLS